jgi:DnaK suppressor protein
MSSHLTPGQRALMESALLQQRRELRQQIDLQLDGASRSEHAREMLLQDGDDAPARDADREVDLALSDHHLAELGAVEDALTRVHSPGYGLCIDCGTDIPFGRLQHHPHVLRCVTCQAGLESRQSAPPPTRI